MLLLFTLVGLLLLLKYRNLGNSVGPVLWLTLGLSMVFLTFSVWYVNIYQHFSTLVRDTCRLTYNFLNLLHLFSVKYIGFAALSLGVLIIWRDFWATLPDKTISNRQLILRALLLSGTMLIIPLVVYMSVFYVHLTLLHKAGPHDSIMTSAFQASLEVS